VWLRRAGWGLLALLLAAVMAKPLLLAAIPRLAARYVNGRVTVGNLRVLPLKRRLVLQDLTVDAAGGARVLEAGRVVVEVALLPPRLVAVTVDSAALQVDVADGAQALRQLLVSRPVTDSEPVQLPELVRVRGRLDLQSDTWRYAVGVQAELRPAATGAVFVTDLTDLTVGQARLHGAGRWRTADNALTDLLLQGELRGDSTTLRLLANGGYTPENGLLVRDFVAGDGIDTVSGSCRWQDTGVAAQVRAQHFNFGARYPQLAWARGEVLELTATGDRALVRMNGEYREGRLRVVVRGELEPERRSGRIERADGWHPALGNFTAAGRVWQDTASGDWQWQDAGFTADRFPLALEQASGRYTDSGDLTISARRFRYERYVLEQPAGAARWQDGMLRVRQLQAGGLNGQLRAQGDISFVPARGDVVIRAAGAHLPAIDALFRREFGDSLALTGGTLDGEFAVRWGGGWQVRARGLQLAGGALRLPGSAPLDGLAATGELVIDDRALTLARLDGRWLGGTLGLTGSIPWSGASDLRLTARGVDLARVDALARTWLAPQQLALTAGSADVDAALHVGSGWLLRADLVRLTDAALAYAPLGALRRVNVQAGLELSQSRWRISNLRGTMLGGEVQADGVLTAGGAGLLAATASGIKLAELDSLLRTRLAQQKVRLLDGTLTAAVAVQQDDSGAWRLTTKQPLQLAGVRVWQQQAGTLRDLGLTLAGEMTPDSLTVTDATMTLPSGSARGRIVLTGAGYGRVADGEITFTGLQLAEALAPLAQLCQPNCRLTAIRGALDGSIHLSSGSDGGLRVAGALDLHEVGLTMSEPNCTVRGLNGRLQLAPGEVALGEFSGFLRDEFAAGWQELSALPAADLTCTQATFGAISMSDLQIAATINWPRVVVSGMRGRLFGGEVRARGGISFAGDGHYALSTLVDGLSTRAVCAAFPGIENYLNGKVRATLWLKGDAMTLNAMKGKVSAWMYRSEDEAMAVHRDLLIRLGGETIRRQGIAQREYLPLDVGELTTRLQDGKMNFEELRLEVTTLFTTVKVGVAEGHDRIGLLQFLKSINVLAQRGVQVDVNF